MISFELIEQELKKRKAKNWCLQCGDPNFNGDFCDTCNWDLDKDPTNFFRMICPTCKGEGDIPDLYRSTGWSHFECFDCRGTGIAES